MERLQRGRFATLPSERGFCIPFISLLLVVISGLPIYTLRVKEATEGRELAAIQVSQGDLLKVEYVHSMYKVKQIEIFSVGHDSRFYLDKVAFGSYAAAAYYDSNPPQGLTFADDLWMVKGDGKNYSVLKFRVSPSTGHVLNIGNWRLDLSGRSQSEGRLIEVRLEKQREN